MQKKVTYKVIFNRLDKLNSSETALIQIEAYLNRKRKYFSTGIYIKPNQWNANKQVINSKNPKNLELNRLLKKQLSELEKFELQQGLKHGSFVLSDFKFLNKEEEDFFNFSTQSVEAIDATKIYKDGLIRVLKYVKEIHPNITFKRLNYKVITDFDKYLHDKEYATNTIAKYHKNFKHILSIAVKQKRIKENPYSNFQIKEIETKRTVLSDDDLKQLESLEFEKNSEHIKNVRDMFLFSCYTGLRFSDMQKLSHQNFETNSDGMFLDFRQNKTSGLLKIPLHLIFEGKAIPIVNEYFDTLNKYLFPRITNQDSNRILKLIQVLLQTEKLLTFHVSRHTFGTLLAKHSKDPYLIKSLMGHKDIQTSMIYIHLSNTIINEKLKDIKW